MISEEVFMDIIAMQHSGLSVRQIALKLGRHRNTVKKHIENKEFPHYHNYDQIEGTDEQERQGFKREEKLKQDRWRIVGSVNSLV